MTFITRLVFLVHFLTALPFVYDPEWAAKTLLGRPKILLWALEVHATQQEHMILFYERLSFCMQAFVGISGLVLNPNNWFLSLGLLIYDGWNAMMLSNYLDKKPKHGEQLEPVMLAFAFGALVGLVGLIRRLLGHGFRVQRVDEDMRIEHRFQLAISPVAYFLELAMTSPNRINIFDVASPAFQNLIHAEGRNLFNLFSHRIAIGIAVVVLLSLGSAMAKDVRIHLAHAVTHVLLGMSFMFMTLAIDKSKGTGGTFEIPGTLHFGVAIASIMSYTRDFRAKLSKVLVDKINKFTTEDKDKTKQE